MRLVGDGKLTLKSRERMALNVNVSFGRLTMDLTKDPKLDKIGFEEGKGGVLESSSVRPVFGSVGAPLPASDMEDRASHRTRGSCLRWTTGSASHVRCPCKSVVNRSWAGHPPQGASG